MSIILLAQLPLLLLIMLRLPLMLVLACSGGSGGCKQARKRIAPGKKNDSRLCVCIWADSAGAGGVALECLRAGSKQILCSARMCKKKRLCLAVSKCSCHTLPSRLAW